MNQKEQAEYTIRASIQHKEQWLRRAQKVQEVVPLVQQSLEVDKLLYGAISDVPPEANQVELDQVVTDARLSFEATKRALPSLPYIEPNYIASMVAVSSGGTISCSDLVNRVGALGTQPALDYQERYVQGFQGLQQTQNRRQQVYANLAKLGGAKLTQAFESAEKAYYATKANTARRDAAGNSMRNLLHNLQGELWQKARRTPKENMTWERMADRLSKGNTGSVEHQALLTQGIEYSRLIEELSQISKEREGQSPKNLDLLWARILEHINAVLLLINV